MVTIEIKGNLTKDAVYTKTKDGIDLTTFIVASDYGYEDPDGARHKYVDYYPVACWGKLALYARYLKQGTGIKVKGTARFKYWRDKDEVPKNTYEVRASEIHVSIFSLFKEEVRGKQGKEEPDEDDLKEFQNFAELDEEPYGEKVQGDPDPQTVGND